MGLKDHERAALSAAELDAFDDSEDGDTDAINRLAMRLEKQGDEDDKAATGTAEAAAATEKVDGGADKAAAADGNAAPAVDEPFAAKMPQTDDSAYEGDRGNLLDERKALREKHRAGDLSVDDYDDQLDEINTKLSRLESGHAVAQHAAQSNANIEAQKWHWTVGQFKSNLRDSGGIDYDKNKAAEDIWDGHVKRLARVDGNADKSYPWFLQEAHRMTIADIRATAAALGMSVTETKPAIAAAVKAAIDARRPPANPKSLANAPSAGGADDGNSPAEFAHLDSLSGIKLERTIAAMSPEQQARWLETN